VLLMDIAPTTMAMLAFTDILYSDSDAKSKDMFFFPMTDTVSSKAAHVGSRQIAYKVKNINATSVFENLISFTV